MSRLRATPSAPGRRPGPGGPHGVHRRLGLHPHHGLREPAALGTDPVGAIGGALGTIVNAYSAMVVGAFGDPARISAALADRPAARSIAAAIRPITETLVAATPLIFAGLAVAVSFRSGVFNIGVEGQFILGAFGAATAAIPSSRTCRRS